MGVLLMAMTVGGAIAGIVVLAFAVVFRKIWLRNFVIGATSVWAIFYMAMLVGFSLTSTGRELSISQPKQFCGFYLDCHMHTTVSGVRRAKTIGNKTAAGEFFIVKVKVFSNAKAATLALHTVDAHVVDASARTYSRDSRAEAELEPQPDFERPISPIESFEKEIVFDLPAIAENPRLDISEGIFPERIVEAFLIGDEDSVLHKRTVFKLDEPAQTAGL
ncbi:MAG TPA: hypothetical protein VNA22_03445 [Pyrinomonadaceae bacterium]|nr:hypothetical protein [Pyrinomonadaceae bacterium]